MIVTFLAILELMKSGDISLRQEETFGEIYIDTKEKEDTVHDDTAAGSSD